MTVLKDFQAALEGELAALAGFLDLLREEQQALVTGKVDGLEALAQAKLKMADRLNSLTTQREQRLVAIGLAPGRNGMGALLAAHPESKDLQARWSAILASAAEAKNLNEINGKLIADRLGNNQQALSILTAATHRASTVYGRDGQTQVSAPGRVLGSA